jgi:hypothetical protein
MPRRAHSHVAEAATCLTHMRTQDALCTLGVYVHAGRARGVDLCACLRVQPVHAFEDLTVFLLAVRQLFFFLFLQR